MQNTSAAVGIAGAPRVDRRARVSASVDPRVASAIETCVGSRIDCAASVDSRIETAIHARIRTPRITRARVGSRVDRARLAQASRRVANLISGAALRRAWISRRIWWLTARAQRGDRQQHPENTDKLARHRPRMVPAQLARHRYDNVA